nr:reverse transcriptase domain-containing protein [Formosa sp. L2A11]
MIEQVLEATNLYKATRQVERNKGASGVDGMKTTALSAYILENRSLILSAIRTNSYVPNSILGVKIPKGQGKTRLLGIPTVVDRWLQQAVSQQLMVHFEYDFEPVSYGFRPQKNIQKAVLQAQGYINSGYQDIVDIDLQGFFDNRPLYFTSTYLPQSKMSNHLAINPKMVKSSHLNRWNTQKAQKRYPAR